MNASRLGVKIQEIATSLNLMVALDEASIDAVRLDQLFKPPCTGPALDASAVTNVTLDAVFPTDFLSVGGACGAAASCAQAPTAALARSQSLLSHAHAPSHSNTNRRSSQVHHGALRERPVYAR